MNCANHADASAVAYCRTCGKGLCANCTRPVKGVIYCEDCLGAKMAGTVPPINAAFAPGAAGPAAGFAPGTPMTTGSSGPNPALAGILGAIPFGVGAVYNGQYGKGLAHLVIFSLLVAGTNASGRGSDTLNVVCGIGIAFFIVYQILDAVRSARAIQAGQAPPDPFGLTEMVTGGARIDSSRIPTGAIVLILLGVLFLLNTISDFGAHRFWPILLIVLGMWLFARNFGLLDTGDTSRADPRDRCRRLMGPSILVALGILFLLSSLEVAPFGRTWPIILLVIGGVKLLQSSTAGIGSGNPPGPGVGPTTNGGPMIPPAPPSEVNRG